MCTTFLASQIINKLKENNIELLDYPRLIRLNPFARFKTRGNGGVSFKIENDDKYVEVFNKIDLINEDIKLYTDYNR